MADDEPVIVMDCGSGMCKAGFAGLDAPSQFFPSTIGRFSGLSVEAEEKSSYVGDCSQILRSLISLRYPIERGIVTDWEDMETIWRSVLHRLNTDPQTMPLLLSEPILNPKPNREKTAQILFESLGTPHLMIKNQGMLSFITSGRNICLVVEVGEGMSQTMAFYESHLISHACRQQPLAGIDITRYLAQLLQNRGVYLCTSAEQQLARKIKERLGYVAIDFNSEKLKQVKENFTLPDGSCISIGQELFRSSEILLQPKLAGLSLPGLHEMVFDSLSACEMDVQRDIWVNIWMSGGTTMFPGLKERMEVELANLTQGRIMKRNVLAKPERVVSAWIGGSILGSLSSFAPQCVTKAEYEEYGPERFCGSGEGFLI